MRYLLLIVLTFATIFINSQNIDLKWSKKYKDKGDYLTLSCGNQSGIYTIRKERTLVRGKVAKVFVEKFDLKTLELAFSTEVILPDEKGLYSYLRKIILIDNTPSIIMTIHNESDKTTKMYAQKLDINTGQLGDKKLIAEAKDSPDQYYGEINIQNSTDGKTALIWYISEFGSATKKWKYDFIELNSSLDANSKASIEFEEHPSKFNIFKTLLYNQAIYLLASSSIGVDQEVVANDRPNSIFKVNLKDKGIKKTPLTIPDKFVHDCDIKLTAQNNIIVTGLSSEKKPNDKEEDWISENKIKNCFVNLFDNDLTLKNKGNFSVATLEKKDLAKNIRIKAVLPRKDGSSFIVMEKGFGALSLYEFQDLYILFMNSDGSIGWSKRIKREENFSGGYIDYYSVQSLIINDKLVLVYSDNKENMNLDANNANPKPQLEKGYAYFPFFTKLDQTGNMTKDLYNIYANGNIESVRIYHGCTIDNKLVLIGRDFERIALFTIN